MLKFVAMALGWTGETAQWLMGLVKLVYCANSASRDNIRARSNIEV